MTVNGQLTPASGSFSWAFTVLPAFVIADGAVVEVPVWAVWVEDETGEEVAPAAAFGLGDGEGEDEGDADGRGLAEGLGDAPGAAPPAGAPPAPPPSPSPPEPPGAAGAGAAGQVFVRSS